MRAVRARPIHTAALFVLAAMAAIPMAAEEEAAWPREFTAPGGARIVIFQPQLDALEGNRLGGRAAVSVTG